MVIMELMFESNINLHARDLHVDKKGIEIFSERISSYSDAVTNNLIFQIRLH